MERLEGQKNKMQALQTSHCEVTQYKIDSVSDKGHWPQSCQPQQSDVLLLRKACSTCCSVQYHIVSLAKEGLDQVLESIPDLEDTQRTALRSNVAICNVDGSIDDECAPLTMTIKVWGPPLLSQDMADIYREYTLVASGEKMEALIQCFKIYSSCKFACRTTLGSGPLVCLNSSGCNLV
eukprot:647697-Pelagomonas_calceolata.AAC.2